MKAWISLSMAAVFMWVMPQGEDAFAASPAYAETIAKEYPLKSAFLYNFAKFVEWPPESNPETQGAFVIGIFGDDPFGRDIDELLGNKTINNKKIIVERFLSLKEVRPCHILFINSSEVKKLEDILDRLEGKSVLTVSETSLFTHNGGMINFVMEDNKVRFEINKQATDKAGLRLSSQLLKLAKSVIA